VNDATPPVELDEQASASVQSLLADGPQAQEVWSVVLDVLDGLVARTRERGWPEDTARRLVAHQFMHGLD
jgi:hypothetical protein